MKKICYVGDNNEGALRRAFAFICANPEYEHYYVCIGPHKQLHYAIPCNVFYLDEAHVNYSLFDLVLNVTDKTFTTILNIAGITRNLTNKQELSETALEFGFNVPATSNFADLDTVFVKPVMSSGAYAVEDFCYRPIKFEEIKKLGLDPTKYLIQQFIDSRFTLQFSVISDGNTLQIYDIILLEFDRDRLGKSLVVYGESLIHQIDEYRMQCDKIITFLKIHGYDKIKGIFSLQFLHTSENSSEWYLHDFNSRTGPFTVELQLSGLIDPRIYRMMKCMVGDMPLSGINENAQRFRHYTEDNGKILSSLNIIPSPERLMLRANKRSGMIRNDYQVFIERIEQ